MNIINNKLISIKYIYVIFLIGYTYTKSAMELHQLRYFISIVETGSFSKAAKRCFVTQPSLSQQIIKLEKELGKKLFDRLGNKIVLTDTGNALLPRAKRILQEVGEIKSDIEDEKVSGRGVLSVGLIPTIAPFLLPSCLRTFRRKFPDAEIKIQENLTENLIQMLIGFKIDIAIMSLPLESELVEHVKLFDDPLVLSVPNSFKLSKSKRVNIKHLENIPFIALDEEHCFGEHVQTVCYEKQINPDVVCKTWNISTILNSVSIGSGISIVPMMTALTNKPKNYVYKKLAENPSRAVVSVNYRKRTKKKLSIEFEKIVKEEYSKLTEKNAANIN